jgi:hypothetical protein
MILRNWVGMSFRMAIVISTSTTPPAINNMDIEIWIPSA